MQYRLRTLLIVLTAAAIFFGGYRLGFQHGRDNSLKYLIELTKKTVAPDSWDDVGGPGVITDPSTWGAAPDPQDPFVTK
jgi:hypothetical protein